MFGQQGNGELLLGRGGFDGSVGNGFSNETGTAPNSGSITTPGQSGSSAFDLSDFPSLGGSPGAVAGGDNNSLANALRQQQQILVQQQSLLQGQNNIAAKVNSFSRLAIGTSMANALGSAGSTGANFKMATEDFPALPGAPLGGSVGNTGSGLLGGVEGGQVGGSSPSDISFGGAPASSSTRSSSNVNGGVFGGDLDGLTNQFDSASLLGSGGVGNLGNHISSNPGVSQQRSATSASTGAPIPSGGNNTGGGGSALSGDYGLLGLLKIIRLSDADRNALAVGSDLTSLGLNLNSSENLYSTFASPWSDSPANREPQYQVSLVVF
jgi:CCR4-NOT transcription complex subunit 2